MFVSAPRHHLDDRRPRRARRARTPPRAAPRVLAQGSSRVDPSRTRPRSRVPRGGRAPRRNVSSRSKSVASSASARGKRPRIPGARMGLPAATTATAAPASRGMSSLATALLRCAVTPPRGVAPRATPNVTRDFHASASTRALRGGSRDDHPLVISGQSASGRGSAKSVVWVPSGAGVRDSGNAAASGAAAAWHQQQHRERQQQYPQRHQQPQQSARPPQRPQVRQQHQAAPQAHHHEATHAEATQPPPQHHQVFAQHQQQHQQHQHQQPQQHHPPPPPPARRSTRTTPSPPVTIPARPPVARCTATSRFTSPRRR